MLEILGGISSGVIILYLIFKFIVKADNIRSYYLSAVIDLNQRSHLFKKKNVSQNLPTSQLRKFVEEAKIDPEIQAELAEQDNKRANWNLWFKENVWFKFNHIDEILVYFKGNKILSKRDLYNAMLKTYANEDIIRGKIKEYCNNCCIKERLGYYELTIESITSPHTGEPINLEEYMDNEKRVRFRNNTKVSWPYKPH